jgi:FkbM family methyltransferase
MNFKSQFREDVWLQANWHRLGLPDVGFFVEFGAGDGVHFSNTYWLEMDRGWTGLLIEPDPRNVVNRPGIPVERACVGPAGAAEFCLHPTDGYLSGKLRTEGERIEIPSLPLSDILRKHNVETVDLISIDTEGTEVEAWRTAGPEDVAAEDRDRGTVHVATAAPDTVARDDQFRRCRRT